MKPKQNVALRLNWMLDTAVDNAIEACRWRKPAKTEELDQPTAFWEDLRREPDRHGALMVEKGRGLLPGISYENDLPLFDRANQSMAHLGTTGSGKSSVNAMINAVLHQGALTVTTSKVEDVESIVLMRARQGRVLMINPEAATPGWAGGITFTPISGKPSLAEMTQRYKDLAWIIIHGPGAEHASSDPHWVRTAARDFLPPLSLLAVLQDRPFAWVIDMVLRHVSSELERAVDELIGFSASPDASIAASRLQSLVLTPERQRAGYYSYGADLIEPLVIPEVMSPVNDDFDIDAFLLGEPQRPNNFFATNWEGTRPLVGCYDTLLLISDSLKPSSALPRLLAHTIRRRRYELQGKATLPLLMINHEAVNSPDAHIEQVTQARGRGVRFLDSFQDLTHAESVHGPVAKAIPNMYPNKLIQPGGIDIGTNKTISDAVGEFDRASVSHSMQNQDTKLASWTPSVSYSRMPILTPHDITTGVPGYPDASLWIKPDGSWEWVRCEPYWRSQWLPLIVQSCAHAVRGGIKGPLPDLTRGGYEHLEAAGLIEEWQSVKAARMKQEDAEAKAAEAKEQEKEASG